MQDPPYYKYFELALLPIGLYVLWAVGVNQMWKPLFFAVLLAVAFYPVYQALVRLLQKFSLRGFLARVQLLPWLEKMGADRFLPGDISGTFSGMLIAGIAFTVPVIPGYFAISYAARTVYDRVSALADVHSDEYALVQTVVDALGERFEFVRAHVQEPNDIVTLLQDNNLLGAQNAQTVADFSQFILSSLYSSLVGLGLGVSIILVALFYLLRYGKEGVEYSMELLPFRNSYLERAFSEFVSMTRALLKMTLIVGVIQGGVGGIVLWYLETPSALMWTIAMMVLSMMPVLGAGVVLLPTSVVYFSLGNADAGWIVFFTFLGVGLLDNILKPKIIGQDIPINEGLIMLFVIGGLMEHGAIGVFTGPIILAMVIALFDTHIKVYNAELREKLTPVIFGRHHKKSGVHKRPTS